MEHLTKNLGIRLGEGDDAAMKRFTDRVNKLFKKMDKDRSDLGTCPLTPSYLSIFLKSLLTRSVGNWEPRK